MRRLGNAARAAGRFARFGKLGALVLACAIALAIPASDLFAYDTFGDGYGSKWDDPHFGTPAVVTLELRDARHRSPEGDFSGGAAWGPPGDDLQFPDALSGDLALNDRNRFTIAPGPDGAPIPTDQGVYLDDVEGLILHELGHALGLGHSDVIAGVMCGYVYPGDVFDGSQCDYTHVDHVLHPDDIAGMREIYGAAAIPVPISPVAGGVLGLLLAALGARASSRPLAAR